MAITRSKPSSKASNNKSEPDTFTPTPAQILPASVSNPPKLFVLPKDTSTEARIVTLNNPANSNPSRYLFCPEKGFYEFTKIAAPKKTPRSWLITSSQSRDGVFKTPDSEECTAQETDKRRTPTTDGETTISDGYITSSPDLFVATPLDILFLILPALSPQSPKQALNEHFLSMEDHLDVLTTASRRLKHLLRDVRLEAMISKRMEAFCDSVDAGDEKMYRLSVKKLLSILVQKAERMIKNGLPVSMEDKFIRPALEVPVMSVKREESRISIVSATVSESTEAQETTATPSSTSSDSQATAASPSLFTPPEISHLLRLRTALTYLFSSYIPAPLHKPLKDLLSSSNSPSFTPLDTHLAHLAKLRAEATVLRSLSDNISRKRGFEDEDEKAAEREEKKLRKEEEDKKRKMETRGAKMLKKVDTSGMKKLSAFFTRVPAKGK
ncbi:hypothetical protein GQ43DRAFT_413885 [Delitschia confertaspora ATCC 74209]|uniref:Ribonuclease H2 subunit B n=1 Tax=Delitschia confertaspora ATCC 74209 TaxID=1513339 RepID=A0A9P4JMX7_9PLEO|nr:hypothetical protein GQ43DRAFT_413885 [Delitschia confertaspora ATCC 74209]